MMNIKNIASRLFFFSLIWGFILLDSDLQGQSQEVLYPSLQGDTLIRQLVLEYKPVNVMTYSESRQAMYTDIDNFDGKLAGVYSGFEISLDPESLSPISEALDLGINCEHSYPQSKGAGQVPAKSNMHHLFPSKTEVNADRGSCRFNEIDDSQTKLWYRTDIVLNSIPTSDIDEYSEKDIAGSVCGSFEPRENRKGDIARAQFYFYTMYKEEADAADADFFHDQKDILMEWNYADPVDQLEYDRTFAIAGYQDDLPNPFVLDSTLARRAYFLPDLVLSDENLEFSNDLIDIFPNPAYNDLIISHKESRALTIRVSSLLGDFQKQILLDKGLKSKTIQILEWPSGFFIFQVFDTKSQRHIESVRFIKL